MRGTAFFFFLSVKLNLTSVHVLLVLFPSQTTGSYQDCNYNLPAGNMRLPTFNGTQHKLHHASESVWCFACVIISLTCDLILNDVSITIIKTPGFVECFALCLHFRASQHLIWVCSDTKGAIWSFPFMALSTEGSGRESNFFMLRQPSCCIFIYSLGLINFRTSQWSMQYTHCIAHDQNKASRNEEIKVPSYAENGGKKIRK